MKQWTNEKISKLYKDLGPCNSITPANTERDVNLPGTTAIIQLLEKFLAILYPGCHSGQPIKCDGCTTHIEGLLKEVIDELYDQIFRAFDHICRQNNCTGCKDCKVQAENAVNALMNELPAIRKMLQDDIKAAYEGDPAARSAMEIVMSYPGVLAVTIHRIAHSLYKHKVPLIPRVMSEHAHSKTGIDIHPGATIGPGFFIDHGTGVVIGETCVIGKHVKIYQGVTLGALSFDKDDEGNLIKGNKRHPDVEDDAIIYAGATILGGKTVIGKGAVIGGNVWLIHSVPAGAKVYNKQPSPEIK
ncbi:MAG: serine acetyltransferase [Kiritimatiellae bacterium]|jgi:serine O-acetyltransferase|nr:serine acetyltransferase [Kiritimatiellia bacterium]